jgi:hypothetical protein
MKLLIFALVLGLTATSVTAAPVVRFELSASPLELVTDEAKFLPFAEQVRAEVERLLGVPAAVDDPATLALLLATRTHLAHHFSDDQTAIVTAAWIRSRQVDPAIRAFAGLTTLASVEARRRHPGATPDDPDFRATFQRALAQWLVTLPANAEIVAMLRAQHAKIAGVTREVLLAQTRDEIAPALARRGYCGLEEADQLVRVRHRLESIVPVRSETLQALEAAIAERTAP